MAPQSGGTEQKASKKAVACDNHPDREAVLVTDGKAYQELHLCQQCIPPSWPEATRAVDQ